MSPTLDAESVKIANLQYLALKEKNKQMQISIQKMEKLCDQKVVNEVYQKREEVAATKVL